MAKKKTSLSQTLFGQIDPYGELPEETPSSGPTAQTTLPLEAIRPDPTQPRQLLPPSLSEALTSGQLTPIEALQSWLNQTDKGNSTTQPTIRELRRLASSIAQHGLINPITVRQARTDEALPPGATYIIVTGERRYWSHVLLSIEGRSIQEGAEVTEPGQIKAMIVQAGVSVRAHQLIENLMREDINAVEKARGLWALRYELSEVNHGSPSSNISEPTTVNHGSPVTPVLVPWSQVEAALDISKRYRIFVTGVLELSTEAQELVAAHSLSERVIRPIVQKLKAHPDLQVEALRQLIGWRETPDEESEAAHPLVASTEALVAELLQRVETPSRATSKPSRKAPPIARRSQGTEQFRSKVQSALRFLNKLDEPDLVDLTQNLATTTQYAEVIEDLRDLRERIDTILEAVTIYSKQSHEATTSK